jgi:hypothetical protein
MTRLPSLDLYNEAVQNPQVAFSDGVLRSGKVRTNGLGLPLALGGGFAITYSIQAAGRTYAIRVFHKQTNGLETRYRSVSGELSRSPSPYFVVFDYQPLGVRVQGVQYPLVKMEWATGDTLGSFLDARYGDRAGMESLRRAFRELANHLRDRGIAHGDVQTGNVMVDAGRLRLIDYDGMFVPGMPLGNGTEIGHRHFQHPARGPGDFGPLMDRFSFIAIDVTLAALVERPNLFLKYATTGENILFTGNDFKDPSSSPVFAELRGIQSLRKSVDDLASVCRGAIGSVPSFDDFIAGRNIPTVAVVISDHATAGRQAYAGSLPVIDALDFALASRHVGDRVELIGQITDVKIDLTRRGRREYVFINFGNWRGRIVKVSIWEPGLAKLRQRPDPSWVGRWVSVTGLMDPPYTSSKYHYTHLSVTVEEGRQLHLIDESEARYRLGKSGSAASAPPPSTRSNRDVLQTITHGGPKKEHPPSGRGARSASGRAATQPGIGAGQAAPRTGNQAILEQIKATAPVGTSVSGPPAHVGSGATPKTPRRDGSGVGCLIVVVVAVILLVLAIRP